MIRASSGRRVGDAIVSRWRIGRFFIWQRQAGSLYYYYYYTWWTVDYVGISVQAKTEEKTSGAGKNSLTTEQKMRLWIQLKWSLFDQICLTFFSLFLIIHCRRHPCFVYKCPASIYSTVHSFANCRRRQRLEWHSSSSSIQCNGSYPRQLRGLDNAAAAA